MGADIWGFGRLVVTTPVNPPENPDVRFIPADQVQALVAATGRRTWQRAQDVLDQGLPLRSLPRDQARTASIQVAAGDGEHRTPHPRIATPRVNGFV